MDLARWLRQLGTGGHGLAINVGLIPYKPIGTSEAVWWNDCYGAKRWEHLTSLEEAPRYCVLNSYLKYLSPGGSVLDVGCGTGILRDRMDESDFGVYVGLDVSQVAIDAARSKALPKTTFRVGELPIDGLGKFDIVICNEMLYYLDDPRELLEVVHETLSPGGYLLTSVWRHRGHLALHKMVNARFEIIQQTQLRILGHRSLSFRISAYRRRSNIGR